MMSAFRTFFDIQWRLARIATKKKRGQETRQRDKVMQGPLKTAIAFDSWQSFHVRHVEIKVGGHHTCAGQKKLWICKYIQLGAAVGGRRARENPHTTFWFLVPTPSLPLPWLTIYGIRTKQLRCLPKTDMTPYMPNKP